MYIILEQPLHIMIVQYNVITFITLFLKLLHIMTLTLYRMIIQSHKIKASLNIMILPLYIMTSPPYVRVIPLHKI